MVTASRKEQAYPIPLDPSDNSNDSGLGFDHHLDFQVPRTIHTGSVVEREVSSYINNFNFLLKRQIDEFINQSHL